MSSEFKRAIEHVIAKINKAEVFIYPFPHLMIDNIWPQDFYGKMIKNFPDYSATYMQPLSNIYFNRYVLNLDEKEGKSITKLPKDDKKELNFWMDFKGHLLSSDLTNAFLEKYENHIDKKWMKDAYPTARLSIDTKGYSIGPHRDRDEKLVSVMFYMPKSLPDMHTQEVAGTTLMIPKNSKMEITCKHYTFDLFETKKRALYKPNSLFSWPVLSNSFHGVEPLDVDIKRDTIGYFIKNKDGVTGRF